MTMNRFGVPGRQGNNRAVKQKSRPSPGGDLVAKVAYFVRYTRSPASFLLLSTTSPIFLVTAPEMKPRIEWFLCRHRHKAHYADVRIMPTCVGNPACGAGIAVMESA
jgi:hypothetical protein